MRKTVLLLSTGVSAVFALLLIMTLSDGAGQAVVMSTDVERFDESFSRSSPLTTTDAITVYLPLAARAWSCFTQTLDDFSNLSSGWPNGGNYVYQGGAYRISPGSDYEFMGASPDWGIPNDATIRVEAWSDSAEGAFGLIFGIRELFWAGDIRWDSWYAFVIEPASQTYWLEYWNVFGVHHVTVAHGTTPAIASEVGTHQMLEVHHTGATVRLIINGVEVDTHAVSFGERRAAGVGLMTTYPTMHPLPTGYFDNFQVIASDCIAMPSRASEVWEGHSWSVAAGR